MQVVCGQQHTLCRAIDRSILATATPEELAEVYVGSKVGCDVYSWGNGMLGQLGLGRRGTSKGRLLPTLISSLQEQFPRGIVDISAGHMFSVVVTNTGEVHSFGHAEYNQHGTGGTASRDYTDAFHFYQPRQVIVTTPPPSIAWGAGAASGSVTSVFDAVARQFAAQKLAHIVSVSCGSNYTIGIDSDGNAYSWGWNQNGVLGHGIGYFSSAPMKISALGQSANPNIESKRVISVASGAKHCVALTTDTGYRKTVMFKSLLDSGSFSDVIFLVDDSKQGVKTFLSHRAILAARSSYFLHYFKAELDEIQSSDGMSPSVSEIDLRSLPFANVTTMASLLEFLYLDRLHVLGHKKTELLKLASYLCVTQLVDRLQPVQHLSGPSINPVSVESTISNDMNKMVGSSRFADVVFVINSSADSSDTMSSTSFRLFSHKAILCSQMTYFSNMFSSNFRESSAVDPQSGLTMIDLQGLVDDGITLEIFEILLRYAYTGDIILDRKLENDNDNDNDNDMTADATPVINESDAATENSKDEALERIDNQESSENTYLIGEDMQSYMSLLVASNRCGFNQLSLKCEKLLQSQLQDNYPTNAKACLDFAQSYNFARLERHCIEALRMGQAKLF